MKKKKLWAVITAVLCVFAFGLLGTACGGNGAQRGGKDEYRIEFRRETLELVEYDTYELKAELFKNDEAVTRAGDAWNYCRQEKIALQAWSPLQYGFFEGVFIGNDKFSELNKELNRLAEQYDCEPEAIALAWILRHPAFKQGITGTTTPERMRALCKAGDISLTREEWYGLYMSTGKILP